MNNGKSVFLIFVCIIFLIYQIIIINKTNSVNFKIKKYSANLSKILNGEYDIIQIGNASANSYETIVSMYFLLQQSKHSHKEYIGWMNNYFKSVTSPIIIYTDLGWYENLVKASIETNQNVTFIVVRDLWVLMRELEKVRNKSYVEYYKKYQPELDILEDYSHNPELNALWNLKYFLMNKTTLLNPYKSEFFIYCDIGAWRHYWLSNWPNKDFVLKLHKKLADNVLLGKIRLFKKENYSPLRDIIEGGFFAGSSKAIRTLAENFYEVHDQRIKDGYFIGNDQTILNILAVERENQSISILRTRNLNCKINYNHWFFFLYFLADQDKFICKNDKFSLIS